MKYYNTIISLFSLSFVSILLLLYLANLSKKLEVENTKLKKEINFIVDQININEIEYSLYNNYEYLTKLNEIYFNNNFTLNIPNKIIYIDEFDKKNFENIYKVSVK